MGKRVQTIVLVIVFMSLLVLATIIISGRNETVNEGKNGNATPKAALEVSESNFVAEAVNTDKKVLIDFYATWCGPCKKLSPILEEVAGEREDIKLIKIDVDKNPVLSEKFNITAMPTLVVLEKGEEIGRSVGLIPKARVLELLNK